jgi:2-C-methyl-D-erythritol 2,4-cyclodiphosphate synthase
MLGAAGFNDIGYYFSDKDEKYRGIRSTELLKQVSILIKNAGYSVENIDSIVVAEYPRVAPKIDEIKQTLATALGINVKQVGVKATTEEGLGFTGRKEGIAAHAVVLLK